MQSPAEIPACAAKPACPRLAPARIRALLAKYDASVPRYTSYPTAAQFSPAIGASQYETWLAALPRAEPVSLYLHIPFCERLCWYCGCHTGVVHRRAPIIAYVETLVREMELVAAVAPGLPVSNLHLGGGTPNILSPHDLELLSRALRERFAVPPDCEIAAELDPRILTKEWIDAAVSFGMRRASLGVQDLAPHVQAAINRRQSYELVAWSVEALRSAGIASVNLDLMYGLPRQKVADALATMERVISLEPDRISLFGYAHVPWMKANQRLIEETDLPDAFERFEQQAAGAQHLEEAGYVRIGLDHFARPQDELARAAAKRQMRRNFQGYTTDVAEALIGIGASSISRLPQGYAQNAAAIPKWRESIMAGRLPTARGILPSADDRFRAEIIETLMCGLAVDLSELCGRHDRALPALADELRRLRDVERDGLVRVHQTGQIEVLPLGRPFIRSICAIFDRHLAAGSGRHARPV